MMDFNEKTRLADILDAYPWLPDTMVEIDSRFKKLHNPIVKALIKRSTLEDASKLTGHPVDVIIQEMKKLIDEHEKNA